MTPEVEREYKSLIEEAEAHFAAKVRWSELYPHERISSPAVRWLDRLHAIRTRELIENVRAREVQREIADGSYA